MKFILDILRGVLIGVANVIPGVSGGTMMVSMGIYDDIISSINGIFRHFKKSVTTLLPYLIGMALGIVAFSFSIGYLFEHFPYPTAFAFIGLIAGGLPVLIKKAKTPKVQPVNIGSFTITGWKRRSSALSFSIYFRYSLRVVAPITWISPRESAGLRMLAALMLPSESPAPTIV